MNEDVSLERLDRQLSMCSSVLGDCSRLIRDLEFNHHENIRRIGEALLLLLDVRNQIYDQRPDLTPEYLKKGWNRPMSAVEGAEYRLAILRRDVNSHKLYLEYLERQMDYARKRADGNNDQ